MTLTAYPQGTKRIGKKSRIHDDKIISKQKVDKLMVIPLE